MKLTKLLKESIINESAVENWFIKNYPDSNKIGSDVRSLRMVLANCIKSFYRYGSNAPTIKPKDVVDFDAKAKCLSDKELYKANGFSVGKNSNGYCGMRFDGDKNPSIAIESIQAVTNGYPEVFVGRCPVKDFLKAYPTYIDAKLLARKFPLYRELDANDSALLNFLYNASTNLSGFERFFKKYTEYSNYYKYWIDNPDGFKNDFLSGKIVFKSKGIEVTYKNKAFNILITKDTAVYPKGFVVEENRFVVDKCFMIPKSIQAELEKQKQEELRKKTADIKNAELKAFRRAN